MDDRKEARTMEMTSVFKIMDVYAERQRDLYGGVLGVFDI